MKKNHVQSLWIILGAYGVWFAIFSGLEEIAAGKYWKAGTAFVLALIIYYSSRSK